MLSEEQVVLLLSVLTPNGRWREDMVVTTKATLDAACITEEKAREALAKEPYCGDFDYTQHIDLALDPEHGFFLFVDDDHTNP